MTRTMTVASMLAFLMLVPTGSARSPEAAPRARVSCRDENAQLRAALAESQKLNERQEEQIARMLEAERRRVEQLEARIGQMIRTLPQP